MIIWKPKTLMGEWWDAAMYEALRQKKLAAQDTPAEAPKATRRGKWNRMQEGSPALALLRFLESYAHQHGEMPTTREIAEAKLPLTSDGHASYALSALESGGWIHREFGQARGIKITDAGRAALAETAA